MSSITSFPDLTGKVARTYPYPLACGGNADIYRAVYSNCQVSVKVLKEFYDSGTLQRRIRREVATWRAAKHPNIVPFLGLSCDFDRPNMLCMVSPWFRNGNIVDFLKTRPGVDKLALVKDVATGLSYLHGRSIIHGGIKGSNILINDSGEASLLDFGRSRFSDDFTLAPPSLSDNVVRSSLTPVVNFIHRNGDNLFDVGQSEIIETSGSMTKTLSSTGDMTAEELGINHGENDFNPVTTEGWRWIAGELMVDGPNENRDWISRITMATDVWSFAMTVIEIFTGSIPFSHIKNDANVILSVTSGGRPKRELCPQINDDIWVILEMCWSADPSRRPPMTTLSQFFASRVMSVAVERSRL